MFLKRNIKNLKRIQTSLNRDLLKGINLDRNEKVDLFDKKLQDIIKKKLSKNIFNTTPDVSSLYQNISRFFKINRDNIYITQGITEAIFQIIFSLVKQKDEIIIMNETYPMYKIISKLHNVKYKTWNFNKNLQLSFKDLKRKINNKTKIEKIAAIGIKVKKWIAYHGFAINIDNNIEQYKKIIPCGIKDKGITNLYKIKNQDYSKLKDLLIEKFILNLEN